jgi:hypothetical protein
MANTTGDAAAAGTGSSGASLLAQDSIAANWAAWIGAGLIGLGLVAFAAVTLFSDSFGATSLGFAAIAGVMILSVSLFGLVVLTRAIGMSDATQALALPNGSIRALLALVLSIVFIAVSSWTLGGLFDPIGSLVYKTEVKKAGDDEKKALEPYGDKQYIVFKAEKGDQETIRVYLKREAPPDQVVDMAKQILTVSATVLVTIVGFYFGSKSAADALRSANANLSAVSDVLSGQGGAGGAGKDDGDKAAEPAPTAEDVAKTAGAIDSLAATAQSALQELGPTPLANLHAAADGRDDVGDLLASAEKAFATLSANQQASAGLAAQAKTLGSLPATADAGALQAAQDNAQRIFASATQANQAVVQAAAAFKVARDRIYQITAKG